MYLSTDKQKTAKYMLVIKLGTATPLTNWKAINSALKTLSDEKLKMFFSSQGGWAAGFFMTSIFEAGALVSALRGETTIIPLSALTDEDSVFISEINNNWSAIGFSSGWSWLQHQ